MSKRSQSDYYDHVPGADRVRAGYRSDQFPTIARDAMQSLGAGDRQYFPFESWAMRAAFAYPPEAKSFLCQCESAAEAYFVRPFVLRQGVTYREAPAGPRTSSVIIVAAAGDVELALQVRCALSRLDAVVRCDDFRLAVEIDGLTYHRQTDEQIAADYIRERRIVAAGYTLIRFTAREAFASPEECWRQIDAILTSRSRRGD